MNSKSEVTILPTINSPNDLRRLSKKELIVLSQELRNYIIDIVSEKGGHFGASLGVVELTIAIHYVFNTPTDQLVWDVGHQAYGHKILTGRRDLFPTNRIFKGISGFPKRSESVYDTFGVGHASTSISAALGMSLASKLKDQDKQHIAVIGDGALTGGLAFEGLNHAGTEDTNLLIILNDNCMSIDPAVGALKEYLTDIATSKTYNKAKDKIWKILGEISKFGPDTQKIVQKVEGAIKSTILSESNYFESLNFRYFGPIDGHDIKHLTHVLSDLKTMSGPKILHCLTEKGKGYEPAELGDTTKWHAPGIFDKRTGKTVTGVKSGKTKYQTVFGKTIIDLANKNKNIVAITPAMISGSSLNEMLKLMPERVFDVGIAEQHAVTFSAGLSTQGMLPFCNIYSTFMQRAYDQVIHDVALQNLDVVFCLDRGGLVGADGSTHHGVFDISYLRCIPNMIVTAPMDEHELRNLMYTAQLPNKGPFTIRYPRGEGSIGKNWKNEYQEIPIGESRQITEGKDIAILSIGKPGNFVKEAQEEFIKNGLSVAHYDMRFVKPLDAEALHLIFQKYNLIITVEDGCLMGGFGSAVLEFMIDNGYNSVVKRLGIEDNFIDHGTQEELYKFCNFDSLSIQKAVYKMISVKSKVG
ncbi:MAG: 1-deoxy-D-xylulose-5-phosphate synthase [Flavobacteriales bacterium]|nr:1-deoxy-D-xylulose-5-phosphate synthase [Flavobacteriales bacterium]|tara:strand:+ start:4095 stop:6014 length:1920 start_codon:yes stop_codon:yes gene_type:complete